jgi:hypothetical protein
MNQVYEKLMNAYRCFKEQIDFSPKIGLVLGSGLGSFAQEVDVKAVLPYSQIDGFPVSTAPGHAGRFVFGFIKDVPVVLMQGRIHYYEGYDITDVVLPERLMNAVSALTGSSPAYVYLFIEAMADGACWAGIPRAQAYQMAAQAVLGAAKMVLETGKHPAQLKDEVCSPGGTTIRAVAELEQRGMRSTVIEAMKSCVDAAGG